MWKLHTKLNFPNIFRLAAIFSWAPAFKHDIAIRYVQTSSSSVVQSMGYVSVLILLFHFVKRYNTWSARTQI